MAGMPCMGTCAGYKPCMRMHARCMACMGGWNARHRDACQVQGMYGWLECQAWGHMPGMRTCIRKTTFEFLCLFPSYHVFSHLIADIRPDKTESTYCMSYHIKTLKKLKLFCIK